MEKRKIRRKQGNTHISLAAIKQYLQNGTYPYGSTPSDKRSVRKRSESFKIEDGELFYIVRPKRIEGEPLDPNPGANKANLRKAIITPKNQLAIASVVHAQGGGTHMGTERTLCALTAKYYWVGMAHTVKKVVKNCVICLSNRPAVATLPQSSQQTAATSAISELDAAVPSPHDEIPDQKKEVLGDSHPSSKTDETANDLQYIVTAELAEPEQVDSDLDFDPNNSIVDAVFNPRSDFDMAKRFWQKVEIQILGPFVHKKKRSVYVMVAMDSYSKWPEVHTSYSVTEKTVSQFCLRLIARYGLMEQLILLENELTVNCGLDTGGVYHNLQAYNVLVAKENVNLVDESWNRIVATVDRFVKLYSDSWIDCLDFCLIPLRNSLTRSTDFTPAYLLMGREPVFPECVIPERDSTDNEVALSQDQIEQSVDTVMGHFLHCTIPDIKRIALPAEMTVSVHEPMVSAYTGTLRKSGRKTKKYHRLAGFDEDVSADNEEEFEENEASADIGGSSAKQGKPTNSSMLYRKPAAESQVTKQELREEDMDLRQETNSSRQGEKTDDVLEKIDLDTYYSIVYLYKSEGAYPPNSDQNFKRTVRKLCENFILENGQLMYRQKGKLKKVLATFEERLKLMKELHTVKGEHMSRMKMIDAIEARNIFWRGMFLDVQAFVVACPGCKLGEPRKRRRASKKALRWFKGVEEEEEDSDFENSNLGQVSYDDIVDYIKKDIIPDGLSRSELLTFRKKTKNFKVDKGVLYYCPNKDQCPRKVLKLDKEKDEALRTAHGDSHSGLAAMKADLRKRYFWQGMGDDIASFLSTCCQPQLAVHTELDTDGEKRNPVLDAKIKFYQDYFHGKNICPSKTSLTTLFPKKDAAVSTIKDLVAAAMESAELTVPSNETRSATPATQQSVILSSTVAGPASSAEVVLADGQNQTQVSQIVSDAVTNQKPSQTDAHKPVEATALKLEIAESNHENKTVNGEKERGDDDNEDGEMMDGLEEEDSRDEEWKPPVQNVAISRVPEGMEEAQKKRCIRKRCEVCQEVIRGDNNFKEHMYKHTKVKPFTCNICSKKFTSIKGLKMHSRKHTGHRPYLCNICGRGFPRSASLRYHIHTHDKGGGLPVVCDVCQRTFTTENRMQKHKRYKHPAQAPVHMCQQCGKVFTAKRSLKRHEEAHRGIRKYECQYCKRSFFRKEYLNYHLASHSNLDPTLANYKVKSKIRSITRKKAFDAARSDSGSTAMSIVCIDSSGMEVSQDQEVYGHLVEVTDPPEWGEREATTMVYEIDNPQRGTEGSAQQLTNEGPTVVVMEERTDGDGAMEVRRIIMPSDHLQQIPKPEQQVTITRPQQQQPQQSFEVTLPTATHTFTLPSGNQLHATEGGQETVQYQVECLSGETLTEDDFNAIRMLAQASLSGTHLVQQ